MIGSTPPIFLKPKTVPPTPGNSPSTRKETKKKKNIEEISQRKLSLKLKKSIDLSADPVVLSTPEGLITSPRGSSPRLLPDGNGKVSPRVKEEEASSQHKIKTRKKTPRARSSSLRNSTKASDTSLKGSDGSTKSFLWKCIEENSTLHKESREAMEAAILHHMENPNVAEQAQANWNVFMAGLHFLFVPMEAHILALQEQEDPQMLAIFKMMPWLPQVFRSERFAADLAAVDAPQFTQKTALEGLAEIGDRFAEMNTSKIMGCFMAMAGGLMFGGVRTFQRFEDTSVEGWVKPTAYQFSIEIEGPKGGKSNTVTDSKAIFGRISRALIGALELENHEVYQKDFAAGFKAQYEAAALISRQLKPISTAPTS